MLRVLFGAHAQVVVGVVMVLTGVVTWPLASFWFARHEPQFLIAISELALIFTGFGTIATGLGYRATERVETAVVENIERADTVVERP